MPINLGLLPAPHQARQESVEPAVPDDVEAGVGAETDARRLIAELRLSSTTARQQVDALSSARDRLDAELAGERATLAALRAELELARKQRTEANQALGEVRQAKRKVLGDLDRCVRRQPDPR